VNSFVLLLWPEYQNSLPYLRLYVGTFTVLIALLRCSIMSI
jgi:hypothetical protein